MFWSEYQYTNNIIITWATNTIVSKGKLKILKIKWVFIKLEDSAKTEETWGQWSKVVIHTQSIVERKHRSEDRGIMNSYFAYFSSPIPTYLNTCFSCVIEKAKDCI